MGKEAQVSAVFAYVAVMACDGQDGLAK